MGDHCMLKDLEIREIPFGDTIDKIEGIRGKITDLREESQNAADLDATLLSLEENLRSAYAELAAKAAQKVADWTPGPKHSK